MPTHAATATPNPIELITTYAPLAAITTLITLGYLAWCWASPFGSCRACTRPRAARTRTGRILHALTRPRGHCHHCDGTGLRLRVGRRFINHLIRLHRDGSR